MKTNYVKTEPTCCTVSGLLRHRSHTLGCMFITFVDDGGGVCHKLIFAIMAGIIVENCPPPPFVMMQLNVRHSLMVGAGNYCFK